MAASALSASDAPPSLTPAELSPRTLDASVAVSDASVVLSDVSVVASNATHTKPGDQKTALARAGGRTLKMRSDGVAYTDENKMIAVHYAFSKKRKLDEAIKDLDVGKTALYRWKKIFPVAAGTVHAAPGSQLAKAMEAIKTRTDADNLAAFRKPTFCGEAPSSTASFAFSSFVAGSASSSKSPPSTASPGLSLVLVRADGLGPQAETEEASGLQPGMLPAVLSAALRRIEDADPVTDAELRSVKVLLDTDVDKDAQLFVKESVSLGVRLKDQNLKDSTKALWVPLQKSFVAWWRALNRLRAESDKEGRDADKEDVTVTEQKLLTWLKLSRILWEFQVALKKNDNDPPDGHLVKQYLKAISLSRAAQSRLRGDDKFANTLKDGYDSKGLVDISRWFILQTADRRRQFAAARDRFSFLWQHAIVGRSEDLRDRELSDFYVSELPGSTPQACPIIVSTQLSSKTNKEARPERGVAARHSDVEVCSIGSFAIYLFSRFHCQKEAPPNFASRESWYRIKLLVSDTGLDADTSIVYSTQSSLLKEAFSACAITSSSLTHAMRKGGSRIAYEAGCTEDAVRKHGRWCGDRMMERYLTGVALQPVRALAGFKVEGGEYWLPRALLEPPTDLAQTIFPWVEPAYKQIQARVLVGGESDTAALEFLSMIKFLRIFLLQDAAVLQSSHPTFFLFSCAPFNTAAFATFQTNLLAKIQNTSTPFDMTLEQIMPTVCHSLASLRATVEKVRSEVTGVTSELESSIRALSARQEQQHAEVMGAIGGMLVMGQGTRQNQNQTRLLQSVLAEGVKSLMSVCQQVSLLSSTQFDHHQAASTISQPTTHSNPLPFPHHPSPPLLLTAASSTGTSSPLSPSPTVCAVSPPTSQLLSSSGQANGPTSASHLAPLPLPSPPSQLESILRALNGSAGGSGALPSFQLPILKSAAELWEEWNAGRDGREALADIRATDEQRYEADKTHSRRLQSSLAVKQQVYRWFKVITFIKEVAVKAQLDQGKIAELLDAQVRKEKGRLARPLRTMADLITNDATHDSLFSSVLASAKAT